MSVDRLMRAWRDVASRKLFVHPDDKDCLARAGGRFPPNRVPEPWFGNPATADVFVLTLNPGHGPVDSTHSPATHDFFWSMIAGAATFDDYRRSISADGLRWGRRTYGDFLPFSMSRICNLRLVAYPTPQKADMGRLATDPVRLPTARMMRDFVHGTLVPGARSGACLLLVMRAPSDWGFGRQDQDLWDNGLFISRQLRTASITPTSRVGGAIRSRLASASSPADRLV